MPSQVSSTNFHSKKTKKHKQSQKKKVIKLNQRKQKEKTHLLRKYLENPGREAGDTESGTYLFSRSTTWVTGELSWPIDTDFFK